MMALAALLLNPRVDAEGQNRASLDSLVLLRIFFLLLANAVLDDLPFQRGDSVLAFVNGLGSTPMIELYGVYHELVKLCAGRGITIVRNLIGPYMTSLEMAGCTITLVKMDDELISLWDAPVKTAALRWGV